MKSKLSRRTLLRGVGVTVALPYLDVMQPVVRAAAPVAPRRAAFIYIPNGVILDSWTPAAIGSEFHLPPALQPLDSVRKHITVVSHLDRTYVSGTGVHAQCGSCWLTSSPPQEALDGGFPTNISLDQMLAKASGEDTLLPSMELSCNNHTDNKETRYFESISWLAPGYAANVEKNPRAVFERMYGAVGQDPEYRSVLDVVLGDARGLRTELGREDQVKLDEYLESVRAVERRIQISERAASNRPKPKIPQPEGMPEKRGEYIRLMMDLIVLAFEQDLTRVATLVIDPERWDSPRMYHEIFDKPEDHHQLTHSKGDEPKQKLRTIDNFHVRQFAHMIDRMSRIREGSSSLLDNSAVVLGSGLGDGSVHSYKDLPLMFAGSAGGRLKNGTHAAFAPGTPLANFWLTILHAFDQKKERFADSTGVLNALTA
jgi:hypothetical protein